MFWEDKQQTKSAPYDGEILDEEEIEHRRAVKADSTRIFDLWQRKRLRESTERSWYEYARSRGVSEKAAEFAAYEGRYAFCPRDDSRKWETVVYVVRSPEG